MAHVNHDDVMAHDNIVAARESMIGIIITILIIAIYVTDRVTITMQD